MTPVTSDAFANSSSSGGPPPLVDRWGSPPRELAGLAALADLNNQTAQRSNRRIRHWRKPPDTLETSDRCDYTRAAPAGCLCLGRHHRLTRPGTVALIPRCGRWTCLFRLSQPIRSLRAFRNLEASRLVKGRSFEQPVGLPLSPKPHRSQANCRPSVGKFSWTGGGIVLMAYQNFRGPFQFRRAQGQCR